ncbi:MAG: hypothetical protein AAFO82_01870, partial [Bacteroidota bacterium]
FMGTWCGDSKRGIPQFYKVMDALGMEEADITLVNLDSSSGDYKQSPTGEEKGLNVHRVPTYIFYKKGEEIGRIVETPVTSYETDISQILNGMPSSPNYKGVDQLDDLFNQSDSESWSQETLLSFARKIYKGVKGDRALNTYGYVLKARGELDKAIAVFEINRMIFPKIANVYDSLAEAYLEKGDEVSAKFYYEKVLELDDLFNQSDSESWSQETLLSFARKIYKGVKGDRALNTYGYVLKARGELDKAIAVFEINRMIFPKIANVYDSLAEAYLEKGDEVSAKFYYEKVLELEAKNENALAQLEKMKTGEE